MFKRAWEDYLKTKKKLTFTNLIFIYIEMKNIVYN